MIDPTVMIVEDDPSMRQGIRTAVSSIGLAVQEFASGDSFLEAFDPDQPGCILMDIRMPGSDGLVVQERLAERTSTTPIIIMTGYADVPSAVQAMRQGAIDFLEKPIRESDLLRAVNAAIKHDADIRAETARIEALRRRFARLTPREHEVLCYVLDGNTNKAVASHLDICVRTVESHRHQIMHKTEAESLANLVRMSLDLGIPGRQRSEV